MKSSLQQVTRDLRTWAEVDLDRIAGNLAALRAGLPDGVRLLAVIKADAYGHGASMVARLLSGKVDYFAVAFADEAVALRRAGVTTPVMVLGHVPPTTHRTLVRYDVTAAIPALSDALSLSREAVRLGKTAKAHLVLDTGMSRIGFRPSRDSLAQIKKIAALPGLSLEGIFSHLSSADEEDLSFALEQKRRFEEFCLALKEQGVDPPLRHLYNSAATCRLPPPAPGEMVRAGIALYGLSPSESVALPPGIRPAMSLRSHIVARKSLPPGVPVSYGCTYITSGETSIATVCAGYADGLPRALSSGGGREIAGGKIAPQGPSSAREGGELLVRGHRAPIVGRVCMDMLMIDVGGIPDASPGDTVTLFGEDGSERQTAADLAARCGTIPYELLCNVNPRVPRVYLQGGEVVRVRRALPRE